MEKTFDPKALEQSCYAHWEQNGYFLPNGGENSYCIMLPPPNVTGYLHMGHGFQQTLMDALIRYHRMSGDNTLWQGGTDHAGIATQMVVERQLQENNQTRHDLGREKFVEKVYEWKETSGGQITQQIRRLGASIDWSRERFTMDQGMSNAVLEVFVRLYEEGLIYRGNRLVNWDPKLQTAISDLEVLSEEEEGFLYHIAYSEEIIVATTRPETLFGDMAVAVHPEDARYKHLIGKELSLPLTNRKIPVIADDYVDPAFGSGCVKITPAHDFNDYEVGQRHQLPLMNILTKTACLNDHVPENYRGLNTTEARKKFIADLEAQGLLTKKEKHTLKVPRGDRSGVVIEPYLTEQWYVKMESLAKPALEAVRDGRITIVPEHWTKTYYQWLENIQDWCISRQLWWGHRIPAWYDAAGKVYVGRNEKEIREKYQLADTIALKQDDDVLDTWFSSALWPFSTLGWPEKTAELKAFYPSQVLMTGFDILFFWVARMIMIGMHFMDGQVPFQTVYITGLIRDAEGQKMSKSKGNVLDPIDLIDGISLEDLIKKRTSSMMQPQLAEKITKQTREHFPNGIPASGCDALRFTFCALASNTNNIRFDLSRLEGYRNFCNKLWNAARYVLMNVENSSVVSSGETAHGLSRLNSSVIDRWILSRLQKIILDTQKYYSQLRFDYLAQCLYDFVWNEFCDWYLELSKPILYQDSFSVDEKNATRYTLISTLEAIVKLLHPIMPFITETIWQSVKSCIGKTNESIMLAQYPQFDATLINEEAQADVEWMKHIIVEIRRIRAEMNVSPALTIAVYLRKGNATDKQRFERNQPLLITLAKLSEIAFLENDVEPPPSATGLTGELEILIPLKGVIDIKAETARLDKEIGKINDEITRLSQKLNNPDFVAKAPAAIVVKEKEKLEELQKNYMQLTIQKEKLVCL